MILLQPQYISSIECAVVDVLGETEGRAVAGVVVADCGAQAAKSRRYSLKPTSRVEGAVFYASLMGVLPGPTDGCSLSSV
jgi:hypothetical protein